MNPRRRAASFRLLAVALMLTGLAATAAVAVNNPFAGGHGNVISAGDLRTFSFAVVQKADGTVSGQATVKNRGMNIRLHVEIDCLEFEAGNRAIMSGPVTQSSNPAQVAPGRIAVFGVEDNGEGEDAPTDRITTIPDYPAPKSCSEFTFVGTSLQEVVNPGVTVRNLILILAGNIQVRP